MDLRDMINDLGDAVSIHRTRHALQVMGCDGGLAMSIPLSTQQVRILEGISRSTRRGIYSLWSG
jgi:hypothetical protein